MWFATFKDGEQEYMAAGRDKNRMPVYEVAHGAERNYLIPTRMHFPGCLRFMPYAEGDDPKEREKANIVTEYGPFPPALSCSVQLRHTLA